jgi:hypothetical protein
MSFNGKFELAPQKRLAGTVMYSFVLKNTSWFGSETIDCMISDEFGRQPFYFRGVKLKAGRSYRFDFDTENWTWCQHDFFAILGKNDKIVKKWQLNLKEYGPGECPDCHGTKQCRKCHGQGFIYPIRASRAIQNMSGLWWYRHMSKMRNSCKAISKWRWLNRYRQWF